MASETDHARVDLTYNPAPSIGWAPILALTRCGPGAFLGVVLAIAAAWIGFWTWVLADCAIWMLS